ncbi:acyltransferase family protein [Paraburkholderia acidisoli]|nr:acyltransferase [Paraburkholderia acidisoli]
MNGPTTQRNGFLDGLRGWAAIMVLLAHLIRGVASTAAPALNKPFLLFPTDGDFAVYVFFVVSGFALSWQYFSTKSVKSLTSLAVKRYPRLTLPILASSLIGFLVWRSGLMFNHAAAAAVNSPWLDSAYGFTASFVDCLKFALFDVFFNYDPQHSYNGVLWTMSIELYGSMLVVGLLAVFGVSNRVIAYLGAALVCALINSPLLAFVFGIVIADTYHARSRLRSVLESVAPYLAVLTLIGCVAASIYTPYPRDARFLSMLAAFSVLSVSFCAPARRVFEWPISRSLGHISFPLYLTHMFVLLSFTSWFFLTLESHGLGKQAAANYVVMATVPLCLLGAIAFLPVESASIRLSRWFSRVCLARDVGVLNPSRAAASETKGRP